MGVEAFGVSMRFIESGVAEAVKEALESYDHITMDRREADGAFETITGEYCDGAHFIGLQIRREIANSECNLAVRFSLCSYESIDAIFIGFVRDILSLWEADVWLMTSANQQKSNYLPGDSDWLVAALPDEIAETRKYWQSLFGTKQGVVRAEDSFSFVGAMSRR